MDTTMASSVGRASFLTSCRVAKSAYKRRTCSAFSVTSKVGFCRIAFKQRAIPPIVAIRPQNLGWPSWGRPLPSPLWYQGFARKGSAPLPPIKSTAKGTAAGDDRVVVAVEELADGSVIFKYGSSEERPNGEDPLETYINGLPQADDEKHENGASAAADGSNKEGKMDSEAITGQSEQGVEDTPIGSTVDRDEASAANSAEVALDGSAEASIDSAEVSTDRPLPSEASEGATDTLGVQSEGIAEEEDKKVTSETAHEEVAASESATEAVGKEQVLTTVSESQEESIEKGIAFLAGAAMLPHPSKVEKGGEDAYYIHRSGQYLGVADGVGGWAQLGVDSGLYSRQLMYQCARLSEDLKDPKAIIHKAHSLISATGSSTVLVAALEGQTLKVANVGDSGFLVVRDGELKAASQQMQHAFNFPYQIGNSGGDHPSDAEIYTLEVQAGDVLVAGTDGLFDNVFEKEIAGHAAKLKTEGKDPESVANWLAHMAQDCASRKHGSTPFAEAAQAAGYKFEGGKMDDITVVVAFLE